MGMTMQPGVERKKCICFPLCSGMFLRLQAFLRHCFMQQGTASEAPRKKLGFVSTFFRI